MALRLYEVDMGNGRTATLRLTEDDAQTIYGGRARLVAGASAELPAPTEPDTGAKQRAPQNKARTPENK